MSIKMNETPNSSSHQSIPGLAWTADGPVLNMQEAVVTTVVTHTTRTTTAFAPIPLPRIPVPDTIPLPYHLSPEKFPLALKPSPPDMRVIELNLGGRLVLVQEDGSVQFEGDGFSNENGDAGWSRRSRQQRDDDEYLDLAGALKSVKGKEIRKRPHELSRGVNGESVGRLDVADRSSLPLTTDGVTPRQRSPPRKKIRPLDDIAIPTSESSGALLSPLPSPDQEAPLSNSCAQPSVGSGLEAATLFSLPAIVSHFDVLPDKIQQLVLMHLFRRSRMPTIQRIAAFASSALKRDFISTLPHEIALKILGRMDAKSLATSARVSRKWRKMVDNERSVWRSRLVEDGHWYGHGVEEEEEEIIRRRYRALDKLANDRRISKVGTPSDDDPMPVVDETSLDDHPTPLKHIYRRRYLNSRQWLHERPVHTSFSGHGTNVVTCLQFDEDKIVSASDDHSINVYSTQSGQLKKRLDGHEGGVWALEYRGDTLVSGSTDRTVRVWDLESLQESHVFVGHTSTVRCLQIVEPVYDPSTGEYQPPYPMIVTGSRDASLRVWKLPKKGEAAYTGLGYGETRVPPEDNPFHVHLLEGHTEAVRALAAYGRICISGSYDKTVRVWDIVTGTCIHVLYGHTEKVYSITYDRLRNQCASGSMDNSVRIWDIATGSCLHTLVGHTSLVGLLGISPNYMVSAAADATLRVWSPNTSQTRNLLAQHSAAITCFQHDETKVISGSDGTLKLWDIKTGMYIRDLIVGISSVWQVAFKDNLLVAASNRNGSTVFDVFRFDSPKDPVDDARLDLVHRPKWEDGNRREPKTYQSDDPDFCTPLDAHQASEDSSPLSSGRPSVRGGVSAGGSRRSRRLADRPSPGEAESALYTFASPLTDPPGTRYLGDSGSTQRMSILHHDPVTPSSSRRAPVRRIVVRRRRSGQSFLPDLEQEGEAYDNDAERTGDRENDDVEDEVDDEEINSNAMDQLDGFSDEPMEDIES